MSICLVVLRVRWNIWKRTCKHKANKKEQKNRKYWTSLIQTSPHY